MGASHHFFSYLMKSQNSFTMYMRPIAHLVNKVDELRQMALVAEDPIHLVWMVNRLAR